MLLDAEGNVLGQTGYQQGGAEPFVANLKALLEQSGWKPGAAAAAKPAKGTPAGAAVPVVAPAAQ